MPWHPPTHPLPDSASSHQHPGKPVPRKLPFASTYLLLSKACTCSQLLSTDYSDQTPKIGFSWADCCTCNLSPITCSKPSPSFPRPVRNSQNENILKHSKLLYPLHPSYLPSAIPAFCYWGVVKSDFKHEADTVVSFPSAKIQKIKSYPYTHFVTAIDKFITITILTDNKKQKNIEEVYSSLMKALVPNLKLKVTVRIIEKNNLQWKSRWEWPT